MATSEQIKEIFFEEWSEELDETTNLELIAKDLHDLRRLSTLVSTFVDELRELIEEMRFTE